MTSHEEIKDGLRQCQDEDFATFMNMPTTRLLLSLVPAAEHADVIPVLLRGAFESGSVSGQAAVVKVIVAERGKSL